MKLIAIPQSDKDRLDEASDFYFVAPNLMLNYRVSEPWQLSLGLSRRISRPTYPQLNPYINLIDNQTYETGNVHLKPEKANKLDLGYTYTSRNRSRVLWLGLTWNFHSYKPLGGTKKQEEDRSVIRLGE